MGQILETKLAYSRISDPYGAPLALIHGWGYDCRFLYPLAKMFPKRDIYLFDLPGYGINQHLTQLCSNTNETALAFHRSLPKNCDVIAWSMGAHFAILAAALPFSKIRTLVTICSSARFPSDPMWPGMDHTLVLKCRQLLDPRRCGRLLRFFAKYQIAANLNHNHEQEFFLSIINDGVIPDYQVLMSGIDLMAYSDVREALKNLNIPCMFLFGAKDVLVPASLAFTPLYSSLSNNKGSEIFIFPDSAHVPFLTEPNLFKEKLLNFYDRVNTFFNFRA